MTDIISYIEDIKKKYGITDPKFTVNISKFLVSNKWFGLTPVIDQDNHRLLLDDGCIGTIGERISVYCELYNADDSQKTQYLLGRIEEFMPKTAKFLSKYIKSVGLDPEAAYHLSDYILNYLPGELDESTDLEIAELMDDGFDELPKVYGDILADFINWTHEKTKTVYRNVYYMNNYSERSNETDAYDPHSYLSILYHLYNDRYIEENDMYTRAAESKNYVDTWLFLALHFLCALRNTDLIRIPHPRLTKDAKTVLDEIANANFPEEDARATVYSVIWHLEALALTPHKTQGTSGVGSIKIHIPESVEIHIGTLFAAAEAHFILAEKNPDDPLIRVITSYEQISRYMGDEIGDLFLDANFRSRAANKSYMQMIYLLTDDILGVNDEFSVKGYMLAALARSHKGSYGEFAKTTSIYLKDAKMSGYTPEFVARELFERGVLSLVPSMLLKTVAGEQYTKLSVEKQTEMIQNLGLTPIEVENSVSIMQQNIKRSTEMVQSLYQNHSKEDVLKILHRIGNGEAVSKSDRCMCLMTAQGMVCPHAGAANCIGCEYEISTKTTMLLMVHEVSRLQKLYKTSQHEIEKQRYKAMVTDIIAPCIDEMLQAIEKKYGEKVLSAFEKTISEVTNETR